jgi:DNA polymerase-3 subunit delta'
VWGHGRAQARLSRAIARDQLHHGLIFVGPPGIGKAALARGLGCALHCTVRPSVGCGTCNTCRRVLAGTHAGMERIEPEADAVTIKVAAARELSNRVEHAPFEGRAHVVVFDPAEALTEQALNALLKTLEEPRPGVHFVMLATRLEALLPTILSRCLVVRLGRLEHAEVDQVLRETLAKSEADTSKVDEARIALAVRLADGRAGLATELVLDPSLESALALLCRAIEASRQGPEGIFAGDKSPLWSAWSEVIGSVKTGRPARERAAAARTAELWLLHLRECIRGASGLPGVPAEDTADPPKLLRKLDRIQTLLEGLERNPNARLALEQTLLEIAG